MSAYGSDRFQNEALLVSRVLLVLLFLIFGWQKLNGFSGTVSYMSATHVPVPFVATIVAIAVELLVSAAIVVGFMTRPFSLLMAVYALATAFLAHHYWTMTGMARYENEINFFKNVSIVAGFILLYVSGPGRYSIDRPTP